MRSGKSSEQRKRARRRRLTGMECQAHKYSNNNAVLDKPLECYGGFGMDACPYIDWCLEKARERFNDASEHNAESIESLKKEMHDDC